MSVKRKYVPIGLIAESLEANKRYSNHEFSIATGVNDISAKARVLELRKCGFLTLDATGSRSAHYMTSSQRELMIKKSKENTVRHGKRTAKASVINKQERSAIDILLFSTAIV